MSKLSVHQHKERMIQGSSQKNLYMSCIFRMCLGKQCGKKCTKGGIMVCKDRGVKEQVVLR